ncbi:MAG: hypothetical protein GC145_10395 [Caulobacter sp.]|nr:hypothetical protein [Caulobacter sp.]
MRAAVLILPLVLLAACGDGLRRAQERARERQAAVDPPELWSVEVVPAAPDVRQIQVCTDTRVREGLARPGLVMSNGVCQPTGEAVKTADGEIQRCVLNGENWVATFSVAGDRSSDFTSTLSAVSVNDDAARFGQVRHFRKLGPCPEGWAIGEATDQSGQRRRPAIANLFQ